MSPHSKESWLALAQHPITHRDPRGRPFGAYPRTTDAEENEYRGIPITPNTPVTHSSSRIGHAVLGFSLI